jgi:RNA polymerase sigma factor (sigma-70 family)
MSILAVTDAPGRRLKPELEELFRENSHMLYCTAYGILGSTADAEDVLQTLFLRLLCRESIPDMQANMKGYLYRATVNLSLNLIRKRKREELVGDHKRFEIAVDANGADDAEESSRRLMEAISKLNPGDAQVLILRYIHKRTDAEIAKLLGVSRGTVTMRIFRSRLRLRRLVGELQ